MPIISGIKITDLPCKKRFLQENRQNEVQKAYLLEIYSIHKPVNDTCEMSTQTEVEIQLPEINHMQSILVEHSERIKMLENQLKIISSNISSTDSKKLKYKSPKCSTSSEHAAENFTYTRKSLNRKRILSNVETNLEPPKNKCKNSTAAELGHKGKQPVGSKSANETVEMVPIGEGHALVPSRLLQHMDWTSYTNATRKLLRAVFSRSVLATHSLTGKPSPAFPSKPAKKQLDPALVNDIVQTVVDNCAVPENIVRTSITTKCADESKMFRSLLQKYKRNSGKLKQENISPPVATSDDSDESYLSN